MDSFLDLVKDAKPSRLPPGPGLGHPLGIETGAGRACLSRAQFHPERQCALLPATCPLARSQGGAILIFYKPR